MTPEACYSALHMLDHWKLMLRALAGQPLPPLPAAPGRRIVAPKPLTVEEDAAEQDAARIWRELAADTEGGSID